MSNHSLPARPNLRHLKDQAKDLVKSGVAQSLSEAQFTLARQYGFESWSKLKAHVELFEETGQLKRAIDTNNLERVKALMTRNPELHRAPLGYAKNGPLTWVAECRVPYRAPSRNRLAIAKWMIENGSDIHQGGDGPLMRAALNSDRIPMMELLVAHGANVNAQWNGDFPIIFAPCESVNPVSLKWLLDHGADPNTPGAALDYLIAGYVRSPQLGECIDILIAAGAKTKYDVPGVLSILRGRFDELAEIIKSDPGIVHRRFPELTVGATGARRLLIEGGTLLHLAAEFCNAQAAKLLLDRGADVNARALINAEGIGGQTAIFHSVSQFDDLGLAVTQLLVERGADLTVRAKLPGHYEQPDEFVECTPLGYAARFPGSPGETIAYLQRHSAPM